MNLRAKTEASSTAGRTVFPQVLHGVYSMKLIFGKPWIPHNCTGVPTVSLLKDFNAIGVEVAKDSICISERTGF